MRRSVVLAGAVAVALVVLAPGPLAIAHPTLATIPSASRLPPARVSSNSGGLAHLPLSPEPASPALTWWNVTNESLVQPSPFWFTEGTWDASDGYLLTYGGDNFVGAIWNTTYTYQSGRWGTEPSSAGAPPGLDGAALAYDPADGDVVMFGGYTHYTPFKFTNLTFTYAGGRWTSADLNPTPPAPTAAAMAYDPTLGGVVMFAGYNNSDPTGTKLLNDLWLYKGGTWSSLADAGPPAARTWPSLAYDPVRGDLVMYGGLNAAFACFGDTWTYDGTWTKVNVGSSGPAGLYGTEMAFDEDLGEVVLTGGYDCSGGANQDSWAFNGSAWNAVVATGVPGAHLYGAIAWDPVDQLLVDSGGTPNATYTDVLSTPLRVVTGSAPTAADVGQNLSVGVTIAGGVPGRTVTWSWGDGSPAGTGANATHAFGSAGSFRVTAEVVDDAGTRTSWSAVVNVSARPQTQISLSDPVLEESANATFTATTVGGTSPVGYVWSFGDGATGVGAIVRHSYTSTGNFTVSLTATDANGGNATDQRKVSVAPSLFAAILPRSIAEAGVPAAYSALISGGVPGYSYNWSLDGSSVSTESDPSIAIISTGSHFVTVEVTDADGVSVTNRSYVLVVPAVTAQVQGPTSVPAGSIRVWNVSVTGGVSPYTTGWATSAGATGTGASVSLAFPDPGHYVLRFFVNDSANVSVTASIAITVGPSGASTSSGPGGTPDWVWIGLGAVIAVGVAAVFLLSRRSKSS